jgi:hypothetical protein
MLVRLSREHDAMHRFLCGVKFGKESTEAFAALAALDEALERRGGGVPLPPGENSTRECVFKGAGEGGENVLFVDMCSGKCLTGVLLTLLFPRARVVCYDWDTYMNTKHLDFVPGLKLVQEDVMSERFRDTLKQECDAAAGEGKLVCLLGLHLCGFLSTRFVELFNSIGSIAACVLSPCCMPSALQKEQRWTQRAAKVKHRDYTPEVDVYTRWCAQVFKGLQQAKVGGAPCACGHARDPLMFSPKSIVMWAAH